MKRNNACRPFRYIKDQVPQVDCFPYVPDILKKNKKWKPPGVLMAWRWLLDQTKTASSQVCTLRFVMSPTLLDLFFRGICRKVCFKLKWTSWTSDDYCKFQVPGGEAKPALQTSTPFPGFLVRLHGKHRQVTLPAVAFGQQCIEGECLHLCLEQRRQENDNDWR